MTVGNYIKKRLRRKEKARGNWDSLGSERNVRGEFRVPSRGCGIFHQNKSRPKPVKPEGLGGSAGSLIKFIFR
jgi:hypothetical protein